MLVARQYDIGRNPWFSSKLEALHNTENSRMPNVDITSAQSDWQKQYSSFRPPEDRSLELPHLTQCHFVKHPFLALDRDEARTTSEQHTKLKIPSKRANLKSTIDGQQWSSADDVPSCISSDPGRSILSSEMDPRSLVSTVLNPHSPKSHASSLPTNLVNREDRVVLGIKDEDEDENEEPEDDEDIIDAEPEEAKSKSDAERRAERRKMKRFRLTHQQTRFLMSEFAKQAHPDAAHRERLSREIPGLSSRQVQVWFQNRRAKIKRLTADDQDRMIKIRAVPEDFDNKKALSSPFNTIHGVESPMKSSADYRLSYTEHLMQPLIIDPTRTTYDSHVSPTTSPAFGHVGFGCSSSLRHPDMLSASAALSSPDRYYGTNILSSIGVAPRGSTTYFNRHDNSILSSQSCHPQQTVRPLQASQFHENGSKPISDTLQSPLRLNMPWKDESHNYNDYHQTEHQKPHYSGQQPSVEDQQELSVNCMLGSHNYESNAYTGTSNVGSSPTNLCPPQESTSFFGHSDLLTVPQNRTAAIFDDCQDPRNQFQSHNRTSLSTTPQSSSFGNNFTANYINTPLTAFLSPSGDLFNVCSPKLGHLRIEQSNEKLFGNQSLEMKVDSDCLINVRNDK